MELVCPAGSLPAVKAAADNGADAVYIGFRDGTNARNFPGLNFTFDEARTAVTYAHDRGVRMFVAINTYPTPVRWSAACSAVDQAVALDVDALILADIGLLRYCARSHPHQRLHLSVQGSATNHESIDFYVRHFGIRRVILPRVLSLAQVRAVARRARAEVEVFGFGSLCVMVEGRCQLSSYVTGVSPNVGGACSPASAVRWEETADGRRSRLNGVPIDVYRSGENAGYPTVCKGRFDVGGHVFYAIEEPTSLNVLEILPQIANAGVTAIKIEGRQRSPAYVTQVTRVLRAALDDCAADPDHFAARAEWMEQLNQVAEGRCHTLGAYDRPWQ
jgi:putative protease